MFEDLIVYGHQRYRYYGEQENQNDKVVYANLLNQAILNGRYFGVLAESNGGIVAGVEMTLLDLGSTPRSSSLDCNSGGLPHQMHDCTYLMR